jgi:Gpi18-like mannosyltransferase
MSVLVTAAPARVAGWERWRPAVITGLGIWVVSRLAFLIAGVIVEILLPAARARVAGRPYLLWPFRLYTNFDADHFMRVTNSGYDSAAGHHFQMLRTPFLPGYPYAGRWASEVIGFGTPTIDDRFIGLALVAWAGAAVAAILLWRLTCDASDEQTATRAVLILLLGPYSLFLMASYSEGLFLALAIGAWLAGRNERWWLAGTLAAVAALVRINSLFLAAGLVVMYLLSCRARGQSWLRPRGTVLLLAPLATFGYIAWLHSRTGSWMTWFQAQRMGWKRHTVTPWASLHNSIHRAIIDSDPAVRYQAWMEIVFAAALLAIIVRLAQKRLWPEFTYLTCTAFSLLTSTYYLSVPRQVLICFPAIMIVAARPSRPMLRRAWLGLGAISLVVLAVNTTTFLTDNWTG